MPIFFGANDFPTPIYKNLFFNISNSFFENEHRLILTSSLNSCSDPKDRSLNYEFKSLKGIIFGIKTKTEDKLKVIEIEIEIVEKKCKETCREDFKFYQAHYSPDEKCITHYEMNATQRYNIDYIHSLL